MGTSPLAPADPEQSARYHHQHVLAFVVAVVTAIIRGFLDNRSRWTADNETTAELLPVRHRREPGRPRRRERLDDHGPASAEHPGRSLSGAAHERTVHTAHRRYGEPRGDLLPDRRGEDELGDQPRPRACARRRETPADRRGSAPAFGCRASRPGEHRRPHLRADREGPARGRDATAREGWTGRPGLGSGPAESE